MSRRSARLTISGYYTFDEKSNAGPQRKISYAETPVRVFKRKRHRTKSKENVPAPDVIEESITSTVSCRAEVPHSSWKFSSGLILVLVPLLLWFLRPWLTSALSILFKMKMHLEPILEQDGTYTVCRCPMADKMADFALQSQGGCVIRYSEPYRSRETCLFLFGVPLWCRTQRPQIVIQGAPLVAGKCLPFQGVKGSLTIALAQPIRITHVTLDHLPRSNSPTGDINSAPKDFEVYGMKTASEEGTLLGTFTYDHNRLPTQTFRLPNPSDDVYQFVELRVLSNWGKMEYTCLYRFRVHGKLDRHQLTGRIKRRTRLLLVASSAEKNQHRPPFSNQQQGELHPRSWRQRTHKWMPKTRST